MAGLSERAIIRLIRGASVAAAPDLIQGIGDDCAVFGTPGAGQWLITTDTLVDSVHFDRAWHPPELLGRKSIAVNLSDIAAMGGRPRFVLLSLCLPQDLETEWLQRWLAGVAAILAEQGCVLIGGDTVRGRELVISVTVIGEAAPDQILYRTGATPGDSVYVSGPLGSAAAGLALFQRAKLEGTDPEQWSQWQDLLDAHLNPRPQVKLGQQLGSSGCVSAMQDVSDGLATDLAHICQESGTGSILYADRLPALSVIDNAAFFLNKEKLDLMLKGGEDYQLLFTVRPGKEKELEARLLTELSHQIYPVGTIIKGQGVLLEKSDGSRCDITFQGYEH
ncbi:MAG: thiamine-phosphate kinase [Desulfoarculaceae bacterium]|nr:thiamine-phosphate kinase [Desulfoarculaceae bacterium]